MSDKKKETPKESTVADYNKEVDTIINGDKSTDSDPLKGAKITAEDKDAIKHGANMVKDENSDRLVFATAKEYNEYLERKEK